MHNRFDRKKGRAFGQNFLQDERVCGNIAKLLSYEEGDSIVEIGPGCLALTKHLYDIKNLLLIEADESFLDLYKEELPAHIGVVFCRAEEYPFDQTFALGGKNKIISNLPFNVSKLIVKNIVINHSELVGHLVLMFQKEVANSIIDSDSAFGAFVATFYSVSEKLPVPAALFKPTPKVDGTVLRLVSTGVRGVDKKGYLDFLHLCFSAKRKKIKHVLPNCPDSIKDFRPHEIKPESFLKLFLNREKVSDE